MKTDRFLAKSTRSPSPCRRRVNGLRAAVAVFAALSSAFAGVNVRDFGAVGDGIADDTRAIAAAVAHSKAGLLEFPHGNYRITRADSVSAVSFGGG